MCTAYGLTRLCDLFTPRQLLTLRTLAQGVRETYAEILSTTYPLTAPTAVATYLGRAR